MACVCGNGSVAIQGDSGVNGEVRYFFVPPFWPIGSRTGDWLPDLTILEGIASCNHEQICVVLIQDLKDN